MIELLAGGDPFFDETMILLDDVVQIWRPSTPAVSTHLAGLFQSFHGGRVGGMAVDINDARLAWIGSP